MTIRMRACDLVAFTLALGLTGCAARPRPELAATAVLPPHVVEVGEGLFSCERGYVIREGRCIPFEELEHGPVVEVSSLPSAGDGAPGTCPSGGCGSYVTPSYSTFAYSGGSSYDYWPTGFYYGGVRAFCPQRARRFRGSELAFGGRFGSFVQDRRFEGWKSGFPGATFRSHSFSARRSTASSRFGSTRTGRGR